MIDVPKACSQDLLLEDDGHGPHKAKRRHVMQGCSDRRQGPPTQVRRDSVIFVAQALASMGWTPGFLDFTQAFHPATTSRESFTAGNLLGEGISGADPRQLLKLLKTCYGLTDGSYAWYQHLHLLRRLTTDFGYRASLADPCVFYKD